MKLVQKCQEMIQPKKVTIQELASLVGTEFHSRSCDTGSIIYERATNAPNKMPSKVTKLQHTDRSAPSMQNRDFVVDKQTERLEWETNTNHGATYNNRWEFHCPTPKQR